MCTLTVLPLPHGGYLLATNRDESPRRGEALPPAVHVRAGRPFLAPIDRDAGGTWVAVDDRGVALCLLNADRPPARPPAADAPSRGLLVLALMEDAGVDAVAAALRRRHAAGALRERGFKLLVVEPASAGEERAGAASATLARGAPAGRPALPRLLWVEWDGDRLQLRERDAPLIETSSGVDPDGVLAARRRAFAPLREHALASWRTPGAGPAARAAPHEPPPDAEGSPRASAGAVPPEAVAALAAAQWRFHAGHAPGDPAGDAASVCMHRAEAHTVSSTAIAVGPDEVVLAYRAGQPCRAGAPLELRLPRAG